MIAEGFHSLADTTNQIFLLIGIQTSKKPATKEHPFGYGKERFFWAFLSALFILVFSGFLAIWRGLEKLSNPEPISNIRLCFLVLAIALILQFINLFLSSRYYHLLVPVCAGEKNRTLSGKFKALWEAFCKIKFVKEPTAINLWLGDIIAVVGNVLAMTALCFVWLTGNVFYDGAVSIVIGGLMMALGLFLIKDNKKLLIGEAVSPAMYEKIVQIIKSHSEVREIIKLKTMHLTPNEILINVDIDFRRDLGTKEIELATDKIESSLRSQIPAAAQISIEVESKK